ncbi:hypothetical protein OH828_02290 [Streptomyces anulatus]|uniref:hypothetical protein n=1 Tax=Streptomyces TaxID=1883 RepID=UPI00206FA730|nr:MULTISPECIES: hypothetical protein [Streptomyces]UPT46421.1 hypothetical protein MWG59_36585 [Streptomyces sp. WAC00303]WIY80544.1 hypothetical protein QPM16_36235 [Streptomyces anulatus]WTF59851.1 hypothetical protein OH791_01880 [Streptomyces anulatus]
MHRRQRKPHSSRRIRVEHGIAHLNLETWRAPARHLGHHEHMGDTVQAIAGPVSQQQAAELIPARR